MPRHKASSEILLYAEMVAPSVMRLKDGALLTGFRLAGPDLESSPPELWAAISNALNDALCGLDHGGKGASLPKRCDIPGGVEGFEHGGKLSRRIGRNQAFKPSNQTRHGSR